jgi:hypothetical protein
MRTTSYLGVTSNSPLSPFFLCRTDHHRPGIWSSGSEAATCGRVTQSPPWKMSRWNTCSLLVLALKHWQLERTKAEDCGETVGDLMCRTEINFYLVHCLEPPEQLTLNVRNCNLILSKSCCVFIFQFVKHLYLLGR